MHTNDHDRLMREFAAWRLQLATAMDNVRDLLENGQYTEASRILDAITKHQAQVSLAVRRKLIRSGDIKPQQGEETVDA